MSDPAVSKALDALQDAVNEARRKKNLDPTSEFAVVSMSSEAKAMYYIGCPCMVCKVQLVGYLGSSIGLDVTGVDLSAAVDAARAVH